MLQVTEKEWTSVKMILIKNYGLYKFIYHILAKVSACTNWNAE